MVGNKDNSREYVNRGGLSLRFKREYYDSIGTKHFFDSYDLPITGRISCMQHLRMSNGTNRIAITLMMVLSMLNLVNFLIHSILVF